MYSYYVDLCLQSLNCCVHKSTCLRGSCKYCSMKYKARKATGFIQGHCIMRRDRIVAGVKKQTHLCFFPVNLEAFFLKRNNA